MRVNIAEVVHEQEANVHELRGLPTCWYADHCKGRTPGGLDDQRTIPALASVVDEGDYLCNGCAVGLKGAEPYSPEPWVAKLHASTIAAAGPLAEAWKAVGA